MASSKDRSDRPTRRTALKIGAATVGGLAAGLPARASEAAGVGDRIYVWPPAATPGASVTVYVASANSPLTFYFYRLGAFGFSLAFQAGPFSNPAGTRPADGTASQDWNWPGIAIAVPGTATTGAYAVYNV